MSVSTAPLPPGAAARPRWAIAIVVFATIAVLVAGVVGIRGLLANPVGPVAADGSASLTGSFEPVECDSTCQVDCHQPCVQGFLQAGARSVFVRFPSGCPAPNREQRVTVTGRPAPDLGKKAYRATSCG